MRTYIRVHLVMFSLTRIWSGSRGSWKCRGEAVQLYPKKMWTGMKIGAAVSNCPVPSVSKFQSLHHMPALSQHSQYVRELVIMPVYQYRFWHHCYYFAHSSAPKHHKLRTIQFAFFTFIYIRYWEYNMKISLQLGSVWHSME
jgi:ligand-binding SRPBCC domain-containing protein